MSNATRKPAETPTTPEIGAIGLAALQAAAAAKLAEAAPKGNSDKPAKKRAKYNIKPANGRSAVVGPNMPEGAFVAYRTHVGQTVMGPANRTRIFLPDMGDIKVEVGQKVETDHRDGSHPNCGIWTVVDITDERALPGVTVRINYIGINPA